MSVLIAFLRAINVGGTGKLPMARLRGLCTDMGFEDVRTYIQSGNVVFRSPVPKTKALSLMVSGLEAEMGFPVTVHLRTPTELKRTLAAQPFPDAAPNQVLVWFLKKAPSKKVLADIEPPGREQIVSGGREVYVFYPDGQGRSRLRLPFRDEGTARNLRTVSKIIELATAE